MPNETEPAREKRPPTPRRENGQGDGEGSAHRPEEFDPLNPAKQGPGGTDAPPGREGGRR